MIRNALSLFVIAFMALMSVGCCSNQRMNVTVQLDDAMKQQLADNAGRKIEVDLIALNTSDHQRYQDYSMTDYWTANDKFRNSATVYPMYFDPKTASVTLPASDPIWNKWFANASDKDIMRLYVLVNLPGVFTDEKGNADPRRQILPLGKCRWDGNDVKLEVQRAGIRTLTQYKADKE